MLHSLEFRTHTVQTSSDDARSHAQSVPLHQKEVPPPSSPPALLMCDSPTPTTGVLVCTLPPRPRALQSRYLMAQSTASYAHTKRQPPPTPDPSHDSLFYFLFLGQRHADLSAQSKLARTDGHVCRGGTSTWWIAMCTLPIIAVSVPSPGAATVQSVCSRCAVGIPVGVRSIRSQ